MEYGLYDVIKLIGALGFFIYGMKVMSEGIQKVGGGRMRAILEAMTSNRILGVFTGFLVTCLVQSSSATTVMVVSFVNAGLLTLTESIGVIMGANIGTTITAWLISILGFKVKMAAIALPIIAVGLPMMFMRNVKFKHTAEILIGFALLFMGLDELKHSVPDLKSNPELLAFFENYTGMGFISTLIFVGVGTILTITVQSSSAAMALTLVMCYNGWIPFEIAASMVLGENIGTSITAYLASLVGNVQAKRAARAHFIFNVFGVIWMIGMLPFFLEHIDAYLVSQNVASPLSGDAPESIPIALSIFHTVFNILNVTFLLGFVNLIVKLVIKLVPSQGEEDEQHHLEFIGGGITATSEISIYNAKQEVISMGKVTAKMNNYISELVSSDDKKRRRALIEKMSRYEEITDKVELEISNYLAKTAQVELSEESSIKVQGMLAIISDLESVADIYYQMSKGVERMIEKDNPLSDGQRERLAKMFTLLEDALAIMMKNLSNSDDSRVSIDDAMKAELAINKYRSELRKMLYKSIETNQYNVENSMIYNDLFTRAEKVGDHIINVTEAITGEKED